MRTTAATVTVHCTWIASGSFWLWAEQGGYPLDGFALKQLLFAWHKPSFYGTFIECLEMDGREGVLLPAAEAPDYFAAPAWNGHVPIRWSEEALPFAEWGRRAAAAIAEGRVVPDFDKWRAGSWGWKLKGAQADAAAETAGTAAAELPPFWDEWMQLVMEERRPDVDIVRTGEERRRRTAAASPEAGKAEKSKPASDWLERPPGLEERAEGREAVIQPEPLAPASVPAAADWTAELWTDEEDWLVSIGWLPDETPFRPALRLCEPDRDETWSLAIVLQDRSDPERLVECDAYGVPSADCPAEWLPYATRIRQAAAKWTAIVPWLRPDAASAGEAQPETAEKPAVATGSPKREWIAPGDDAGFADEDRGNRLSRAGSSSDRMAIPLIRTEIGYNEAWDFLTDKSIRLAEFGQTVLLPAWWENLRKTKPRLKAQVRPGAGSGDSLFGLNRIVEFDWRLAVGEAELSEEEFRRLVENGRQLVRIHGRWVLLDPSMLRQVQMWIRHVRRKKGLSFGDVLEMHLLGPQDAFPDSEDEVERGPEETLRIEIELNEHLRSFVRRLGQAQTMTELAPPSSFRGTLRPYQLLGASWLLFLRRFGLGGCLADDMGLGKTIQWITYLLLVKERELPQTPSLLICPTSVLGNWVKELERFAPTLTVGVHYGPGRPKGEAFVEAVRGCDLVLTSYALAHLDEAELTKVRWNSVCLDEAQNIKNAYTKQATSVRKLQADHRIAMTGTPIENRLTELWSIFDFINPGYLGNLRSFARRYSNRIERTRDKKLIAQVQRLAQPFLLRRVKNDPAIELDLPEKLESKTYVSLTAEQAALYESVIADLFDRLDRLPPMERRGLILSVLTKLKQICNHPAIYTKESAATADRGSRSQKLDRLIDMVKELRQEGDRCLIFTQFVEMGKLLQRAIKRETGEEAMFLHGETPRAQRDKMIARFQETDECGVFLLSLKAGGIGLNLTAASHVFHFDRWWNPAVENQATDRAFRIGQTKRVQVHKFVTLGTLEEKIDEMIERKQLLSRQIVGSGEQWITELSTDQLKELFALRRHWIEA